MIKHKLLGMIILASTLTGLQTIAMEKTKKELYESVIPEFDQFIQKLKNNSTHNRTFEAAEFAFIIDDKAPDKIFEKLTDYRNKYKLVKFLVHNLELNDADAEPVIYKMVEHSTLEMISDLPLNQVYRNWYLAKDAPNRAPFIIGINQTASAYASKKGNKLDLEYVNICLGLHKVKTSPFKTAHIIGINS